MRVEFVPCGDRNMAGSRIRAWDLVDAWNDPSVSCTSVRKWAPSGADVVVMQKVFPDRGSAEQPSSANALAAALDSTLKTGARVYWDLADPIWCWMEESEFIRLANQMSGIVVSSLGLRNALRADMGFESTWIDDRLPPPPCRKGREHAMPPTFVWFGYSRNRTPALAAACQQLTRLAANRIPLGLLIIDDLPEKKFYDERLYRLLGDGFAENVRWSQKTFWTDLIEGDIALLPKLDPLKSGNKTTAAKWAGLPVWDGLDYAYAKRLILEPDFRHSEGQAAREWAEDEGNVQRSVEEWKVVIGWEGP